MSPMPKAVFLLQLVQDVSIVRPLLFMAARDFNFEVLLLVSSKFTARDTQGIWLAELKQIADEAGARLITFREAWQVQRELKGYGLLFAASESNLPQHASSHGVFRHAPHSFLRVTLQHGFECVGLQHSADHVRAHGVTASFSADIICTWTGPDKLTSVAASQLGKLFVTGPTSVLQQPRHELVRKSGAPGLVCENLHSVRYKDRGDPKREFVKTFAEFAGCMSSEKRRVALRTHPGGQYALKNGLRLPDNVQVEHAPIYRLDLRRYAYGISAPSSILIDLLLAGIPTAVWRDSKKNIDAGAYEGLAAVSSVEEWTTFARNAERDPEQYLVRQQEFLERTRMPLDPRDVFARFAQLFQSASRMEVRSPGSAPERERILFVANGNVPTLQLSFDEPLAPLVARGEMTTRLLSEQQMRTQPDLLDDSRRAADWVERYLDAYSPSLILFCRYSGPVFQPMLDWARRQQVPVIYHVDDDLLGVPPEVGERKSAFHNSPSRLATLRHLLNSADLVYASTNRLKRRLLSYLPHLPIVTGEVYCSGSVLRQGAQRSAVKVGYMASADHAHNLEIILPAIDRMLEAHSHVRFELFGSIPMPDRLQRFGDRVGRAPPIRDYRHFLEEFALAEWDVGLCPLAPIDFNMMKANTKWVEYTSAGAAVVASRGTVYDECCSGGCGILAGDVDEWFSALDLLINNVDERLATIERAQAKLRQDYSPAKLRRQVLDVFAKAHAVSAASKKHLGEKEISVCPIQ